VYYINLPSLQQVLRYLELFIVYATVLREDRIT